jgi:hypothetical protein
MPIIPWSLLSLIPQNDMVSAIKEYIMNTISVPIKYLPISIAVGVNLKTNIEIIINMNMDVNTKINLVKIKPTNKLERLTGYPLKYLTIFIE